MTENAIGTIGGDGAVELHRDLRPGLLETVYEVTLARFLEGCGLGIQRQVAIAVQCRGAMFDEGSSDFLCASLREEFIEPDGSPKAVPPLR